MSEHENGNFVLKCGQNQQKYQSFMAISDFALLYRIRRSAARFLLLSYSKLLCLFDRGLSPCLWQKIVSSAFYALSGNPGGDVWKMTEVLKNWQIPVKAAEINENK